jgi:hypothetical protein
LSLISGVLRYSPKSKTAKAYHNQPRIYAAHLKDCKIYQITLIYAHTREPLSDFFHL